MSPYYRHGGLALPPFFIGLAQIGKGAFYVIDCFFLAREYRPYSILGSFLLNYGPAMQDITDEDVLKRLHDFNCEWMKSPNIAISEMAMTLKDNLKLFRAYSGKVFEKSFVDELEGFITPLLPALKRLDNKDKDTTEPPTKADVPSL